MPCYEHPSDEPPRGWHDSYLYGQRVPSGYEQARRKYSHAATWASIEQWKDGNSETPFRLCEAFEQQFAQERAEKAKDHAH